MTSSLVFWKCCWETLTKNIKKEAAGFVQEKTLVKDLIKPVTGFMPAAENKNRVLLVAGDITAAMLVIKN